MRGIEISSRKSLSAAIQLSCVAIITAFLALGLFMLFLAGGIADRVRLEAENQLVATELDRQIQLLARDQSQISHWDATILAFADRIDPKFVREELVDWLWGDFGIDTTIVISTDGTPRVVVEQDRLLEPLQGVVFIAAADDLVRAAKLSYMRQRRWTEEGYVVPVNPVLKGSEMFASDIRPINGQMGIVVAQAIIPEGDATLPEGPPQVLLTFKAISPEFLRTMGKTLGLSDIQFLAAAEVAPDLASVPAGRGTAGVPVMAAWRSFQPSKAIWSLSAIPMLALLALVAGILVFVARRSSAALSALEASERQNRFLALHDALTELPNRLQFDRALEDTISRGLYDRCAILCIDLDRFKAVNDSYGHQVGDVVIKTIAGRISGIIGQGGFAARLGGDEFVVLLHNETDRDSVLLRCGQLIESVCQPVHFEGGTTDVGASVGVAWWPDDAVTAKAVIRSADEALYMAKKLGRGRTCFAGAPERDQAGVASRDRAA